MYLVSNYTSKKVHVKDLNLYIDRKQVIDLHRLRLKMDPSESKDLKKLIRAGTLRELNKPGRKKKPEASPPPPKSDGRDDKKLLNDLKQFIKEELDKRNAPTETKVIERSVRDNSDDVLQALSEISSQMQVIKEQGISVGKSDDVEEEDENPIKELDEEKLSDIHARAVNKMTEKAEGSVTYSEKEVENPEMLDHVSELEDIL